MEYMTGAAPSFKGLPLPEGVDRHNLYASAFRVSDPGFRQCPTACAVGPARAKHRLSVAYFGRSLLLPSAARA